MSVAGILVSLKKPRRQHHQDRVNRLLDYVAEHPTGDAGAFVDVACFSPFHFHRIFQGINAEMRNPVPFDWHV